MNTTYTSTVGRKRAITLHRCTEQRLQELIAAGTYQQTDTGPEKRCCRCGDFWPADTEFFFRQHAHSDGLSGHCKACA